MLIVLIKSNTFKKTILKRSDKVQEYLYEITDENNNEWEVGLRDIKGKGRLSGYIKINEHEFIISNFNTLKSAVVWWDAFNSMLKKR
jgi:hypothetical protein